MRTKILKAGTQEEEKLEKQIDDFFHDKHLTPEDIISISYSTTQITNYLSFLFPILPARVSEHHVLIIYRDKN